MKLELVKLELVNLELYSEVRASEVTAIEVRAKLQLSTKQGKNFLFIDLLIISFLY